MSESPRPLFERIGAFLERHRTSSAVGGIVGLAAAVLLWRWARPSNRRKWNTSQERLATARLDGDILTISNVRRWRWKRGSPPKEIWDEGVYDLRKITGLDFTVSRFGLRGLAAHTMLIFGFSDGQRLVLSVEIRRREGQHYSMLQGFLRSFELMYVWSDERDVLHLRTNVRDEATWLYPMKVQPPVIRKLLLSAVERTNYLAEHPEFYHSMGNACATNLMRHFNESGLCRVREKGPRTWLPGLADGLLHELGLIGESVHLKDLRRSSAINAKGQAHGDGEGYSEAVRR